MLLAQLQVEKSIYPREKESLLETMNLHQDTSLGGVSGSRGLCFNCPWRPQASTAPCSSAVQRSSAQNTGDPQGPLPPKQSGNGTVLGILCIDDAAFGIITSLKNHLLPYPACVKTAFISSQRLTPPAPGEAVPVSVPSPHAGLEPVQRIQT